MLVIIPVVELGDGELWLGLHGNIEYSRGRRHPGGTVDLFCRLKKKRVYQVIST